MCDFGFGELRRRAWQPRLADEVKDGVPLLSSGPAGLYLNDADPHWEAALPGGHGNAELPGCRLAKCRKLVPGLCHHASSRNAVSRVIQELALGCNQPLQDRDPSLPVNEPMPHAPQARTRHAKTRNGVRPAPALHTGPSSGYAAGLIARLPANGTALPPSADASPQRPHGASDLRWGAQVAADGSRQQP